MAGPSNKAGGKKKPGKGPLNKPSHKPPFKKKENSYGAVSTRAAAALHLEDDVPDFPRGGGSSLGRAEKVEVRAEVDGEFESEKIFLKKKKRDKFKTSSDMSENDLGSLFSDGITGKLPRFANRITFKNVSPGMKLWGVIVEVNEKDLVVSLPGGLRGLARASEALDPLHNEVKGELEGNILSVTYHVGQLVPCVVLQLDEDKKEKGQRKLWLSLRLALLHKGFTLDILQEGMVLNAYIKSIEDHGYMLHFGLASFTGFMPSSSQNGSRDLKVNTGKLVQGVVKSIDKARNVVYLSSDPNEVSKCVIKDLKGISIDLLVPGMMVNASVRSTLENGIMLSFLTYFTGTVDLFHLQNTLPTSNWKNEYPQNKKVNARILFVDPSTRAVGLSLNPHLVHNNAPPFLVKTGDIFDHSKVIRVDRGSGLLLEISSSPVPVPAYVNVSDVADKEVGKLEKIFKEGSHVRVRVLGFRHLEGLATGVLKTSAFEGSVFTHSDVKPGMVVKAKVIAVDVFGAIVQLAGGVKALCPLRHMSEFELAKPRKKFQVGMELVFRVLGCKSKRITVTHKRTLVKSKLDILSSYADATEGLITHGWITKIENHGCFVRFYNGVQGFAPRSELGLDPGSDASSMYHVEQVVKCRVTSSVPASRRINLSFIITPARQSPDSIAKIGDLVSGVVERVTPHAIIVTVNGKGFLKGTITPEHLADNHGLAASMKLVLKPGYEFEKLLVLDIESSNLVLTSKYSLVNTAHELPLDISQVRPHSLVHGYVCNIIDSGCFVRFLGRLTGFAPKSKASDDRKADLSEIFYIGQSVRSNILDVSGDPGKISLSLKQSLCSSTDASFIQEYFALEDKIAKLQNSTSVGSEMKWVDDFCIGGVVEGKVDQVKESGVAISFAKYNGVFGFITPYQLGGATLEVGSMVQAMVVDVAKMERLVDLSLKPEFLHRSSKENPDANTSKKSRKRLSHSLEVNQTVNAVVEIVKQNYLVLSIPENNFAIGYASLVDYNTQKSCLKQFVNGQRVIATIAALPDQSTFGRSLLLLKSVSEAKETSSSKRAKKNSSSDFGALVQAEITEIKPLELRVKFGSGFSGRIHITEVNDEEITEGPFIAFRIGQTLSARIVSKPTSSERNKKSFLWDLSIKPSVLAGFDESGGILTARDFNYSTGQRVTGFVYKVDGDWAWLTISRDVRAQLYFLDSACEPSELEEFQKRFHVGKAVSGYVLTANVEKKLLRLSLHSFAASPGRDTKGLLSKNVASHFREGEVLGGRICKILPGIGGLLLQIDPQLFGKVHFTELVDVWTSDPLSGFHDGQLVKCKVIEISYSAKGTAQLDLSLRSSLVDMPDQSSAEPSATRNILNKNVEKIEDLHPNMVVQGYVKNVTPKGCFIMLSRKLDAKILLSNLSDDYVENPEEQFPIGKLVCGKVLSVEPLSKRIEVTLRSSSGAKAQKSTSSDLTKVRVGEIISGRIKRVESYGLFIIIDQSNVVALCHVSELPEDNNDSIESKYIAGEKVKAKILKVDVERNRVSLGMKESYFSGVKGAETDLNQRSDDSTEEDDSILVNNLTFSPQNNFFECMELDRQFENEKHPILAEVESRASVPPLEVSLDDIESPTMDIEGHQSPEHIADKGDKGKKNSRRAKKKEKEDREREIRALEERRLEKAMPESADEYEKLVRVSPNSSFIWIKYMAFMLSVVDIEKARSIADRALQTINFREDSEKLNVWVAYLNLENEYGNPPEKAVEELFKKALEYCDPKKLYLALLGMYERTEQNNKADALLDTMVKRFKKSCKVWLRRIVRLLKENRDGVQSVLNRALICLPKHKHIKFITQTALHEFKGGVPERGRSMFEGMLREYPKRIDLWSVYLDQEIRLGDLDVIRSLFERATSLELPVRKMKFLFKKYLELEKSMGNEERVEYVKKAALEYLEKAEGPKSA